MVGHFQLYNNSIFRIFITVVTVVTVATVKFPLSYCRDSNFEDSSTKSTPKQVKHDKILQYSNLRQLA